MFNSLDSRRRPLGGPTTGIGNVVRAIGPALTDPTVNTQAAGDSSTKVASTAYVDALHERGTWTPSDGSGAGLAFTLNGTQRYVRWDNHVTAWFDISYPVTGDGSNAKPAGLPYTSTSDRYAGGIGFNDSTIPFSPLLIGPATSFTFQKSASGVAITNVEMTAHRASGFVTYTK